MKIPEFSIDDCINETADIVITSSNAKSSVKTQVSAITIECYNQQKSKIVHELFIKLLQLQNPAICVLYLGTSLELGLTIEIDREKLTKKLDTLLQEAGCTTRVIVKT